MNTTEVIIPVRLHRDLLGSLTGLVIEEKPGYFVGHRLQQVASGPDLAIVDWTTRANFADDATAEGE